MFTAVKKYHRSCLYPSLNMYILRCFLNDEIVVIDLISAGKQFNSLGAAVTKARCADLPVRICRWELCRELPGMLV